jgi:hypothetical protein
VNIKYALASLVFGPPLWWFFWASTVKSDGTRIWLPPPTPGTLVRAGFCIGLWFVIRGGTDLRVNPVMTGFCLAAITAAFALPGPEPSARPAKHFWRFAGQWAFSALDSAVKTTALALAISGVTWLYNITTRLVVALPSSGEIGASVARHVVWIVPLPDAIPVPGSFYIAALLVVLLRVSLMAGVSNSPVPMPAILTLATGVGMLVFFANVVGRVPREFGDWSAPATGIAGSLFVSFWIAYQWAGLDDSDIRLPRQG